MSRKILIANWKSNPESLKKAQELFKSTALISKKYKKFDVVVCPPSPFLLLKNLLKIKSIKLGAQDVGENTEGAFTGKYTSGMLASLGADYVIIGHSENRALGEGNQSVSIKINLTLKSKLIPVLCIGEKVRDDNGDYLSFIKSEILESLADVSKTNIKNIIIAYEPIWAVGKGATRVATSEEFTEIKIFIRKVLSDAYGSSIAEAVHVIYGGSVNSQNALSFMKDGDAFGLLVGRDSLNAKKLEEILKVIN